MELFNFLLYEPEPSILKDLDPMYSYIENIEPIYNPDICHLKVFDTNLKRYLVLLRGLCRSHGFIKEDIHHDRYVICADRGMDLMKGEYIYHLDNNLANDDIDNLKVIDTTPVDIEVKHPYDPVRYYGRRYWNKKQKKYIVCLLLKNEYVIKEMLRSEKEIQKNLNTYIIETELKNGFLDNDEKAIFIDGNKTNYDVDNLKIMKIGEVESSIYPIGEIPFQNYYIGKEYKNKNRSIGILLLHIKDRSKNTTIKLSKYKYCVKLGRKLERNEYLIYKDGNRLNDDINNLTHGTYKKAGYPFDDYYEGIIYENKKEGRRVITLLHKTDSKKNITGMKYARYRMQVILGRLLDTDEEVDHIDANKFNDADDNLQILTKKKHNKKSEQDKKEMAPKVEVYCDGCNKEFERHLSYIRQQLNQETNKFNNIFCSNTCRWKYMRKGNKIKYKKLIKYTCTGTGKEIELSEDMRFLPSKFNPDALPFYDYVAVLNSLRK